MPLSGCFSYPVLRSKFRVFYRHCRLWDLDSTILQSVEGKLRQNQRNVKNSTAYTMAVIFNAICESQSDLLLDPYLNSIGGAPAGSEKGGENQCF